MSSNNHNALFSQGISSSEETTHLLVLGFLDELKSIKLDTIELWYIEKRVHAIVSHSSTEIRNVSFKMLIKKGGQSQDSTLTTLDKDDEYLASITEIGVRNITRILEDLVNEFSPVNDNDNISDDEYRNILQTVIQDTMESASEMVRIIIGGIPSRMRKLDQTTWTELKRKTSLFFFYRFTKEFILCLVAKLKKQFLFSSPTDDDDDGASIVVLLSKVDWLVEKILPKTEDHHTEGTVECYFTQIAKEIKEKQFNLIDKQLAYFLILYLKPGPDLGLSFRWQLQEEADALIDTLLRWLQQQAEQHKKKTDLTSAAMIKIGKISENLLALANGFLVKENDTSHATSQPTFDVEFDANESISDSQSYTFKVCHFMVVKLVNAFINPCAIHIYWCKANSVVTTLTERLFAEIRDSEIVAEVNDSNADALFKEMKKDLSGNGNCTCWVQMALLCQDPYFLEYAIESLKKHLLSPLKKFCISTFFKRLYRHVPGGPLLEQSQDRALFWQKLDIPNLGVKLQPRCFTLKTSKTA